MVVLQSCRTAKEKMLKVKKSKIGHRMAPGPEPVRGPFVAVTDQNRELVGGNSRSWYGDSGTVIRVVIGVVVVMGCWSKGLTIGPVERRE